MKLVTQILRYVTALLLIVFGANKLFNFMPQPPMEGDVLTFMMGLMAAPYFMPLLAVTEIGVGILLALNKYTALAAVILAPIALNMALFHLSFDIMGGIPAYIVAATTVLILVSQKEKLKGLLTA